MKICCISDTHEKQNQVIVPDADMLIHAGDLTTKGSMSKLEEIAAWFKQLPHKHKICIAGNHDFCFENNNHKAAVKMFENAGVIYLQNSNVVIDGLNIFGSPATPWFHSWAFNYQRGKDIAKVWSKIPDNCDILITHGPPSTIMDQAPRGFGSYENVGCEDLLSRIAELKNLKLHVFGHIHNSYSPTPQLINGVQFVNASSCNENYQPVNSPVIVEI